ncbi:hypothetical protein EJB05_49242, partial [Eragrostis curvula]
MATGTKCLGAASLGSSGDLVHNAQAEVVARRALLHLVYAGPDLARGACAAARCGRITIKVFKDRITGRLTEMIWMKTMALLAAASLMAS